MTTDTEKTLLAHRTAEKIKSALSEQQEVWVDIDLSMTRWDAEMLASILVGFSDPRGGDHD